MNFINALGMLMETPALSENEAYIIMNSIGIGAFNEIQNAALIIALGGKEVSLEEITGFRKALLELSVPTNLESYDTIDLCGTGGDGKNTFNISTLASFVVAAAGYKVAKHGNYGVSSISGSSNVLEKLGYRFSNDVSKLERELNAYNICFLHAPLFHPALKNVANVRRHLGIKTIFNTLGPLVNPAKTKKQFVGVFNLKLARLYHYLLQQEGKDYVVVHSLDGYDEISLTGQVQYFSSKEERLFTPEDIGFPVLSQESLFGGETVEEAAKIFLDIIEGKGTETQNNTVIANAGAGIQCFEKEKTIQECIGIAREALTSGKSNLILKNLIKQQ